ncbi:MAG: hypothetical protein P4L98_02420 [Ancalomicrobiaceae bacterium]|nr:hypothetical protein [Ancalomicrobiaceae bacterium]
MKHFDTLYLAIGATWLVVGMLIGIGMGITHKFELAPLHAHINLVGFACHAIFGAAYRLWPAMAKAALAKVQFVVFVVSTPILAAGLYFTLSGGIELPTILGSLGVLTGAVLFAIIAWRSHATA